MGTLKRPVNIEPDLYERDFYEWCLRTAERLKNRDFAGLDWDNVIEEIEALAGRDKRELFSRVKIVLVHLLKWRLRRQLGGGASESWKNTLYEQRGELRLLLDQSPSLRRLIGEAIASAYGRSVNKAAIEMKVGVNHFPSECPFTPEQVLNDDFLPE